MHQYIHRHHIASLRWACYDSVRMVMKTYSFLIALFSAASLTYAEIPDVGIANRQDDEWDDGHIPGWGRVELEHFWAGRK